MLEFFKHHKIASIITVVGGAIVFLVIVRGSGSGGVTTSSISTAQVAADAQLQAAQIAAQAHAQDTSAAVTVAHDQVQGQIDIATILAGIESAKTAASQTVALATLDNNTQMGQMALQGLKAQLDAQTHAADLSYYATSNAQNIGYNEAQVAAETQRQHDQLQYTLDYAQQSANLGIQNKLLDTINSLTSKAA